MSDEILSLENFLPYRLNRLADAVSRSFSRIYRDRYGLTRPEWRLLATLGQYDEMTATAIGKHSAMHKTMVSRAVSALENRQWLKRATDTDDRRIERIKLTKAGQAAYRDLAPLAKDFERQLWDGISATRRAEFGCGLDHLEQIVLGEKS